MNHIPRPEELLPYDKTTEVLKHIDYLIDGGASGRGIARAAGLTGWTISRLLSGETARVTQKTYDGITALKLSDVHHDPTVIDEEILHDIMHTKERVTVPYGCKYAYIKALADHGWCKTRISERLRCNSAQIDEALGRRVIERKGRPMNVPSVLYKAMRGSSESLSVKLQDSNGGPLGMVVAKLNPATQRWEVTVTLEERNSVFRTEVMNLPEMENDPWAVIRVALTRRGRQNGWH